MAREKINYSMLTAHDLARLLDEQFPLRNPGIQDDLGMIQRRAGQRDVVEFLLTKLQREDNG